MEKKQAYTRDIFLPASFATFIILSMAYAVSGNTVATGYALISASPPATFNYINNVVLIATTNVIVSSYTYNFLIYNPSGRLVSNALYVSSSASNSFSFDPYRTDLSFGTWTANVIITTGSNTLSNSTHLLVGTAALPITLYNYQTSPLTANTPIPIGAPNSSTGGTIIGFNASLYRQYETCNLNNIEFIYHNGTVIPSWMEGTISNEQTANGICTNNASPESLSNSDRVLYWLNLGTNGPYELPAGSPSHPSSNTIYMVFAGNTVSQPNTLLNNNNTGEAPQLPCSNPFNTIACSNFGEYDNGAKIFQYYVNWAGTSLPVNWDYYNGRTGGVTINNGLTLSGSPANGVINSYNHYNPNNDIIEAFMGINNSNTNYNEPLMLSNYTYLSYIIAYIPSNPSYEFSLYNGISPYSQNGVVYQPPTQTGNDTFSVYTSPTAAFSYMNYGISSLVSMPLSPTIAPFSRVDQIISISRGAGSSIYMHWLRLRNMPPDNINPGSVTGQLQAVLPYSVSLSNSRRVIYNANTSTTFTANVNTGGISQFTFNMLVYAPNGVLVANALYANVISNTESFTFTPDSDQYGKWTENVIITNSSTGVSVSNSTYVAVLAAYVPITVSNNQPVALQKNATIAIGSASSTYLANPNPIFGMNAIRYQQYETCNLNNAVFFYSNGTIIPSWLEGNITNEFAANALCTSAGSPNALAASNDIVYWLNMGSSASSFLPAGSYGHPSSNVLYIGWAGNVMSTSNTLFDGISTGEAPQLSCQNPSNTVNCNYAEYDNGGKVFHFYDNFKGTSINTGLWTTYAGVNYAVNNGLTLSNPSTYGTVLSSFAGLDTVQNTINASVDTLLSQNSVQTNNLALGLETNHMIYSISISNPSYVQAVNINNTGLQFYALSDGLSFGQFLVNMPYISSMTFAKWVPGNPVNTLVGCQDYLNCSGLSSPLLNTTGISGGSEVIISMAHTGEQKANLTWIRTKVNPPNGFYPTYTMGNVLHFNCAASISNPSNSIVDVGQYESFTTNETGCTNSGSYTYAFSTVNSINDAVVNSQSYSTSSTSNTFAFQPTTADSSNGIESANVVITGTATVASAYTSNFVINPSLANIQFTTTPSLPNSLTVGQALILNASWTGGTGPYTVTFYISDSNTNAKQYAKTFHNVTANSIGYIWSIPPSAQSSQVEANVVIIDSASTPAAAGSSYAKTLTINPYTTPTVSVPSGILYYLPLVFKNNHNFNTNTHYQQVFSLDSNLYQFYTANNMQNIEFFYANGTAIPANWIPSNNFAYNTIYWLQINPVMYGGGSNLTVYMGFASKAANTFAITDNSPEPSFNSLTINTVSLNVYNAGSSFTAGSPISSLFFMLPGQNSNLTAGNITNSGGPRSYTYQWYEEKPGSQAFFPVIGATTNKFNFTTQNTFATGNYYFIVNVTSGTSTATEAFANITLTPAGCYTANNANLFEGASASYKLPIGGIYANVQSPSNIDTGNIIGCVSPSEGVTINAIFSNLDTIAYPYYAYGPYEYFIPNINKSTQLSFYPIGSPVNSLGSYSNTTVAKLVKWNYWTSVTYSYGNVVKGGARDFMFDDPLTLNHATAYHDQNLEVEIGIGSFEKQAFQFGCALISAGNFTEPTIINGTLYPNAIWSTMYWHGPNHCQNYTISFLLVSPVRNMLRGQIAIKVADFENRAVQLMSPGTNISNATVAPNSRTIGTEFEQNNNASVWNWTITDMLTYNSLYSIPMILSQPQSTATVSISSPADSAGKECFNATVTAGAGPYNYTLTVVNASTGSIVHNFVYTRIPNASYALCYVPTTADVAAGAEKANVSVEDSLLRIYNSSYSSSFTGHLIPVPSGSGSTGGIVVANSGLGTSTISTTIPPKSSISTINITTDNATIALNISSFRSTILKFIADKTTFSFTSSQPITGSITVHNVTSTIAKTLPKNYTKLRILNISIDNKSPANANFSINVSMQYNCSMHSNRITPFVYTNNSWSMIKPFSVNIASCAVTFALNANHIMGIFSNNNTAASATTPVSTAMPTNITTTTSPQPSQAQSSILDYIIAIIIITAIVVAIMVYLHSRRVI